MGFDTLTNDVLAETLVKHWQPATGVERQHVSPRQSKLSMVASNLLSQLADKIGLDTVSELLAGADSVQANTGVDLNALQSGDEDSYSLGDRAFAAVLALERLPYVQTLSANLHPPRATRQAKVITKPSGSVLESLASLGVVDQSASFGELDVPEVVKFGNFDFDVVRMAFYVSLYPDADSDTDLTWG